jgi:EmrB/QacA subfamily drug resistance transporter
VESTRTSVPARAHWAGLVFLTLAVLTSVVDSSVMTVATPTITKAYHTGLSTVEWTATIYSLVFGATMLLWSKVGSTWGYRRVFILGSLVFAAGSALVGWSPNIGVMIGMRALQGAGAAMFNPAAIALIALLFPPGDRPLAYGINGMAGSVGVALGYVLGGACAQYIGWRWAFYVNLPICLVAILGALKTIPVDEEPKVHPPIDVIGAVQSFLGLGLLIFGLSEGETFGWWRPKGPMKLLFPSTEMPVSIVPAALAIGALLVIAYAARELRLRRHGRNPVFDVTLFAIRSFRWGGIVAMLRYLAQFTINYGVTLFLQVDEGLPAFKAALVSLPNALAGLVAGPLGGWFANKVGVGRSVQIGMACQAAGIGWVALVLAPRLSVTDLIVPFGLFGFGAGLAGAQLNTATLQDVPRERTGDAAGAATTLRQLGASFAVAIFAILSAGTTARLVHEGYSVTWQGVYSVREIIELMMGVSLACLALSFRIPNHRPKFEAAPQLPYPAGHSVVPSVMASLQADAEHERSVLAGAPRPKG